MNKLYKVRFEKAAQAELKRIDKNDARIIMAWISKNLVNCQDPYVHGNPLKANSREMWRYRIGEYRIISNINDNNITILNLENGHRSEML